MFTSFKIFSKTVIAAGFLFESASVEAIEPRWSMSDCICRHNGWKTLHVAGEQGFRSRHGY